MADVYPYPEVGEAFELTLDGDAPENQPLEMVRRDGLDPTGWQYRRPKVRGRQTRRFKLIRIEIGYYSTFGDVLNKLSSYGKIPEGQWREAFKTTYPRYDDKGPVGIADNWLTPVGGMFPCIDHTGKSDFRFTSLSFPYWRWRWLIPAE